MVAREYKTCAFWGFIQKEVISDLKCENMD
jgi:hypothetical protein